MESKTNLEPLPDSSNKEFWGDAEIHTNLTPQNRPFFDQPHFFVRKAGKEAQCTHCDWGFHLDTGDRIRDGHLYDKMGVLIV